MNKQDCLVFDCDEVLLNHLGAFHSFIFEHYNITPNTEYPVEYNLGSWFDVSNTEINEMIKHFNERSYRFGLLEPLQHNTVEVMHELRREFPNNKIVVLTKSGTGGHGEVLRKVNLINVFGYIFDDIIIIEMYESKKGALYQLQQKYNVKFLVDDYIKNIKDAMQLGIRGIMLKSTYNEIYSSSTEFDYVNNWSELRLKIYEILNSSK